MGCFYEFSGKTGVAMLVLVLCGFAGPDVANEPVAGFPDRASGEAEALPSDPVIDEAETAAGVRPLDVAATGLSFYEGGKAGVALSQRRYDSRFVQEDCRYLYWQLNLKHPEHDEERHFSIEANWFREDGTLYAEQMVETHLEPEWTNSVHTSGYGSEEAGSWPLGEYRLEVLIDRRVVATGSVRVVKRPLGSAVIVKPVVEQDVVQHALPGMMLRCRLTVKGRRGRETDIIAVPRFADGKPLRDFDGYFREPSGHAVARIPLLPKYNTTRWKRLEIFFPYEQLHLARGKHKLRIQLRVHDPSTGRVLTSSEWLDTDITWK